MADRVLLRAGVWRLETNFEGMIILLCGVFGYLGDEEVHGVRDKVQKYRG